MKRLGVVLLAVGLAGCGSEPAPPPPSPPPAQASAPAPDSVRDSTTWAVSPDGAGPVRVGMDLAALAPFLTSPADSAGDGCGYVEVRGAPEGLHFMVEDGRLVRVEVREGETPTEAGARIGDAESRIAALYPGVRVEPHKYTDGHYLIALPGAPADTLHRLVFETDGSRVTRYRAGLYPPVEYVEGCG